MKNAFIHFGPMRQVPAVKAPNIGVVSCGKPFLRLPVVEHDWDAAPVDRGQALLHSSDKPRDFKGLSGRVLGLTATAPAAVFGA